MHYAAAIITALAACQLVLAAAIDPPASINKSWRYPDVLQSLVPYFTAPNSPNTRVAPDVKAFIEDCFQHESPARLNVFTFASPECIRTFASVCKHLKHVDTLSIPVPPVSFDVMLDQDAISDRDNDDEDEDGFSLLPLTPFSLLKSSIGCDSIRNIRLQVPLNAAKNTTEDAVISHNAETIFKSMKSNNINYLGITFTGSSIDNEERGSPASKIIQLVKTLPRLNTLSIKFSVPSTLFQAEIVEVIRDDHQHVSLRFLCSPKIASVGLSGYGRTAMEQEIQNTLISIRGCLQQRAQNRPLLELEIGSKLDPNANTTLAVATKEDEITARTLSALAEIPDLGIKRLRVTFNAIDKKITHYLSYFASKLQNSLQELHLQVIMNNEKSSQGIPFLLENLSKRSNITTLGLNGVGLNYEILDVLYAGLLNPSLNHTLRYLTMKAPAYTLFKHSFNYDLAEFVDSFGELQRLWSDVFDVVIHSQLHGFNFITEKAKYSAAHDNQEYTGDTFTSRTQRLNEAVKSLSTEVSTLLARKLYLLRQTESTALQMINGVDTVEWIDKHLDFDPKELSLKSFIGQIVTFFS